MSGKLFVLAIPSEGDGGHPMRALAGVSEYKQIAFPTKSGRFVKTPVAFMYLTTPHRNEERIDAVRQLHVPDNENRCVECRRVYPCRTIRTLDGETC